MSMSAARRFFNNAAIALSPDLRRLLERHRALAAAHAECVKAMDALLAETAKQRSYIDIQPITLQFRRAFFEAQGRVAPDGAVAGARAWPNPDNGTSYREKLLGLLPIESGSGAELGPLNLPLIPKQGTRVVYVDHVDTDGLQRKYPYLPDIAPVDFAIAENSLEFTLRPIAPLDYFVASQVMEHVANPIKWLRDLAAVIRPEGLVALSLPDRRMTFDFLRQETRASDILAAYVADASVPDVRSVYDHHSQASLINMRWASDKSVMPEEIVAGRGRIDVPLACGDHMSLVRQAQEGTYLDVHAWVFTPPTFILAMAQLAGDGLLPFRLHQFYPTVPGAPDRDNASFTVILERCNDAARPSDIRMSFLQALWPE